MQQRSKILVVLLAWFFATGAHWDLVQTYGWGKMIAQYASTMSLGDAIKKTFDGEMCGVCEVVDDARQADGVAPLPSIGKMDAKILLCLQPAAEFVFLELGSPSWSDREDTAFSHGRGAPPLPPPRALA